MTNDGYRSSRTLQRIAGALGTDVADLFIEAGKLQATHEALELLSAFERIVDPKDRRVCLDYINAVAARQNVIGT